VSEKLIGRVITMGNAYADLILSFSWLIIVLC
jgi:hypothetical protein